MSLDSALLSDATRPIWRTSCAGENISVTKSLIQALSKMQPEQGRVLLDAQLNANRPFEPKELTRLLISQFPVAKDAAQLITVARRIVDEGNDSGVWKLCPPPIAIVVARQRNPHKPGLALRLSQARSWQTALLEVFKRWPDLNAEQRMGVVLANAAIRGGMMAPALLAAVYRQAAEPLIRVDTSCHIDLRIGWRKQDDFEIRRWYLDPLSEALHLSLDEAELSNLRTDPTTAQLFGYISAAIKRMDLAPELHPRSMTHFLECLLTLRRIQLPAFLCEYAARYFVSHSLKPEVWHRLHGIHTESIEASDDSTEVISVDANVGLTGWQKELRGLWSPKAPDPRSTVQAWIRQWPDNQVLLLPKALAEWCWSLRSKGEDGRAAYRASTIKQNLFSVDARLYGQLGDQNLLALNAEAFEEVYEQVLEDAVSTRHRQVLANTLRLFHGWLASAYPAPPLDEISVLPKSGGLAFVDANVITESEYKKALNGIPKQGLDIYDPDLPEVACLLLILGYRCGFRRSEIQKIRLADVQGRITPEILVRPHATRRLKTKNAVRRIPVHALLSPTELKRFLKWIKQRESDDFHSQYVFALASRKHDFVPEERVFPAIHLAMRAATGDKRVRYHHLRHSFASLLLYRLVRCEQAWPQLFPKKLLTMEIASDTATNRQMSALYGFVAPTRRHLYLVSALLGHSSPKMSLEHYVHLCDVMLYEGIQHADQKLSKEIKDAHFVSLTPVPESTSYRWLKGDDSRRTAFLSALRKKRPPRFSQAKSVKRDSNNAKRSITRADHYKQLYQLWKGLYLLDVSRLPEADICERLGLDAAVLARSKTAAEQLANMHDSGGKKTLKHRMLTIDFEDGRRSLCPQPPRKSEEINAAKLLSRSLMGMAERDEYSVKNITEFMIRNMWRTKNYVLIKEQKIAHQLISQFQQLANIHVEVQCLIPSKLNNKETSAVRSEWAATLGLSNPKKLPVEKAAKSLSTPKNGSLIVRLAPAAKESDFAGQLGFRWAWLMRWIREMSRP